MQYAIILINRKTKAPYWYEAAYLPGMILPERIEPMLTAEFADQFDLCRHCDLDCRAHPIAPDGRKYCTMLLWDAIKPPWRLTDILS